MEEGLVRGKRPAVGIHRRIVERRGNGRCEDGKVVTHELVSCSPRRCPGSLDRRIEICSAAANSCGILRTKYRNTSSDRGDALGDLLTADRQVLEFSQFALRGSRCRVENCVFLKATVRVVDPGLE